MTCFDFVVEAKARERKAGVFFPSVLHDNVPLFIIWCRTEMACFVEQQQKIIALLTTVVPL